MEIGKIAAHKGNGQNQRVEGTHSKDLFGKVSAKHGERAHGTSHTDSVQISGSARSMGHVVQSLVSQIRDMDSNQLDSARIQDYRERLESGALTTPAIIDATASRILEGTDGEIASFPSLEQRGL